MTDAPTRTPPTGDLVCPHCGRAFRAPLLLGPGEEPQGYKCPHCRLFVALERAEQGA